MKRAVLFVLIASLLLLSISAGASQGSASQNPRTDQRNASAHNSRDRADNKQEILTATPPAAPDPEILLREALKTIQAQAGAQPEQARAQQVGWRSASVLVQICLVIVGLLYSTFALLQWFSMRQSLQVTQRAYVNVNRIERIEPEGFEDSMFSPIDFVIRNSGRTPAKNLLIQVGGEISKEPLGKGIPTDPGEIPRTPYHGMGLPPDTDYKTRFNFPSAHLTAGEVHSGELHVSCWATISYVDHFGMWHLSIEPFYYDAVTHTFDRHPVGYREADRRYETYPNLQRAWRVRVWLRSLIKGFR